MTIQERFDKIVTGLISGFLLPLIVGLLIYVFSPSHLSLHSYLTRLVDSGIVTHSISLCVFPNILIFLLFNRFDMLKATKGVLAVTIVWAIVVFGVKFLG
jgi:hypothetical protein